MSWQPLLQGTLAERAQDTMRAILDDLSPLASEPDGDPSLASGDAGLAILHGYLAQSGAGVEHAEIALRCIERALAAMADKPTEASLYSGLTGVGWALVHLQGRLSKPEKETGPLESQVPSPFRVADLEGEDELADIDHALLHHLEQSPWREDYDLVSGLVGFGVYALERMTRPEKGDGTCELRGPVPFFGPPAASACLERVVERLEETAERRNKGLTWWTNPDWLPTETREKYPRGYYNLGLAHGVPGVIAILGLICAAASGKGDGTPNLTCPVPFSGPAVVSAKTRPMLDGAVHWLLAQQQPGGFAHWVQPEAVDGPARLAWCYGDPGVAAALLGTARSVREPTWEREAVAIARRAAERPPQQAGVRDAGLCHGAAGLGHLFNRMFQATGEPQLGAAASYWFEQTLAMRRPGPGRQGIGGYHAWRLDDAGESTWVTDPGLLTGSTGIALALLAATTPVEPSWDRMLLVDIPPTCPS